MGKGTKHKADWAETTLQVAIDAKRLYCHSCKIMANEKVFSPGNDFLGETLLRIQRTMLGVYLDVWSANRLNVAVNRDLAGDRLRMQVDAVIKCRELLALFELAKNQFHIPSDKFWNWMDMLVQLLRKLEAWHKSDVERYGDAAAPDKDFTVTSGSGSRLEPLAGRRVAAFRQ